MPYKNSREFRLKLLASMLDDSWMARYGGFIIKPEYFSQADEEAFAKGVLAYRAKYGSSPDDPYDLIELADGKHPIFILDIFEGYADWDLRLAQDYSITFAQEAAASLAVLESVDDIQAGNIQAAIERMKAALDVGRNLEVPGIDPVADVNDWLYDYWSDKVPTGWLDIDRVLDGGLGPGELGLILGPQNKGKSMCLINIGFGGASILSGRNVVHFTHEMRANQVAKRYAARLTFRFPKRDDDLSEYAEEIVTSARRLLKGHIKVIGGGVKMTVQDIEGHINRLQADGFEPGLIVDDYPDLLIPPQRYSDKRFELSAILEWYRAFADKLRVPVWGASQSNREAYSKEIITLADIAEDIGKASIADVIVSLCQTYDEQQVDMCRLMMAKVRDGQSRQIYQAKYYGAKQAIVTIGEVVAKHGERDV